MRRPRRYHSAKFKAYVALEAIRGEKRIAEIGGHYEVRPTRVTAWMAQVRGNLAAVFGAEALAGDSNQRIRQLHEKIEQLAMERECVCPMCSGRPRPERREMSDGGRELTVKRQAQLLGVSRTSVYYRPRPVSEQDLKLIRRLDELHLEALFYGARKLAAALRHEGHAIGRRLVGRLMRSMGIEAMFRRARTNIPIGDAAIYPYLLENVVIERLNQI